MITDNFKNKMLKAVRDSIYCFSYKVNGEIKEKYPYKTTLGDRSIIVNLLLDSNDVGKITDIKLLDIDRSVLFESNAIYLKDNSTGNYITFEIKDIMEVSY